jgi:serine/threonine protein kinase
MGGNISKTGTEVVDGIELFTKKVEVDKFDTRTLAFQSQLRQHITGKFKINRYESIQVVSENSKLVYKLQFEKLNEKDWSINAENMEIIGKSMAYMHNHSSRNYKMIRLPVKNEEYNSMDKWLYFTKDIPFKEESYNQRLQIFKNIDRLNTSQPKIPIHRDFRKHNILFDGETYNLIDFDFAAVDFVSLEVMGFVSDIIESGINNVKVFLKSYFENLDFDVKPLSFVDDYLNYLCTNTFPFYMSDSLEPINFQNLVEERNKNLETLYNNRLIIKEIIEDITYEINQR